MELDYRAIGKRIKIARIKADLTQEALAEKASLSTTHMSNIETGNSKLSLPTIVSLANALSTFLAFQTFAHLKLLSFDEKKSQCNK